MLPLRSLSFGVGAAVVQTPIHTAPEPNTFVTERREALKAKV
jgi:hypothetical protein